MTRFMGIVMILFVAGGMLYAEDVNLQALCNETQKCDMKDDAYRMIWWVPTEYWKASFKDAKDLTPTQKKAIFDTVDQYIVCCVIDAKISALASITSTSRNEIMGKLSLTIDGGKKLFPLPDAKVSSDAKNLFGMMKPIMANMLGQFGRGIEFICFKSTDSKGRKLLDPKKKGLLTVYFGSASYKFRLPLGSLLPPKYDPKTGEKFPGNYNYNPYTGSELTTKPLNPSTPVTPKNTDKETRVSPAAKKDETTEHKPGKTEAQQS